MRHYATQIAKIEESHGEHSSFYVFEDRIFAAPISIDYAWSMELEKSIHRICYSDDQRPIITIERDKALIGELADALKGGALIKLVLKRGWTSSGVWQSEQDTLILFELEDDAKAFAGAHNGVFHAADFAERWLSGRTNCRDDVSAQSG